eukprot:5282461-Pyramimonas_sp.AAC.1
MSRPWSRCTCGRCQYNDLLIQHDRVCQNCQRQVKLYKPRRSPPRQDPVAAGADDGDQSKSRGKGKDGKSTSSTASISTMDVPSLLKMAANGTENQELKKLLQ